MPKLISHLTAREILDSRGFPTVECTCHLTDGFQAAASVPSGASTGSHEAVELRDNDPLYFEGKGVRQAVNHIIEVLSPGIAGEDPIDQAKIDRSIIALDGTKNKAHLGANALLAVSLSVARAGAFTRSEPLYQHLADLSENDQVLNLPTPFFNILNGGLHAGMNLDFQEFIIVPNRQSFATFSDCLKAGAQITHSLQKVLSTHHFPTTVGDEGGFAPLLKTNQAAIELIIEACQKVHLDFSQNILISFDFAANTYFHQGKYSLKDKRGPMTPNEYVTYLEALMAQFKPFSFEDPFPEDAWDQWTEFTHKHTHEVKLIGDDFLVTNPDRLNKAIQTKACNAILIKPNQIGTLTEAIAVVNLAKKHGFMTVASHRSGETTDDFIADFAVGVGTDYVKFGAPVRGERVVKYNRLLQIEAEL